MPLFLRLLILCLVASASGSGTACAQEAGSISIDDGRRLAEQAAVAGDDALALELALALLRADPDDRDALTVLAAVLPRRGDAAAGRRAATRAWTLSDTPAERFEAARLAAAAAFAGRNPLLAEFWLRAALVSAPTPEGHAQTLADARAVRGRSPWRLDVQFAVSPSDNVNGGSESPFSVVEGLPFVGVLDVGSRALSGWISTLDARLTRRLSESARQRTDLSVQLSRRGVRLSDESRDLIAEAEEDVTGSDFTSTLADLRLAHRRALSWGLVGAEATLGRTWPGEGEPVDRLRLSASAGLEISEGEALRFALSVEERRGRPADDQRRLSAEIGWTTRLRNADHLTISSSRSFTLSDLGNQASNGWGVLATYSFGDRLGPIRLSASLGAAWTEFPDYAVFFPVPGGRQDERVFAGLDAAFEDWSIAGFAPVVSLEAARSDSNVSRFDTESLGLGFSFRSTF